MHSKMRCLAVIPCFNDESHLTDLIPKVQTYLDDVLLIDDGSYKKISSKLNCHLIRNSSNMGKGYSIKKSFHFAIQNGFTHIITLDADGQHPPEKIPNFLDIDPSIDIVLGRRNFSGSMPVHRRISNKLTSWFVSLFLNNKVYDSQCGFRRYKVSSFGRVDCIENGFQYESEVLIKGLLKGSLSHVEIPTIYSNEKSSINNFVDTIKFIRLIFRNLISK